jgi:hypothetical protein
MNKILRQTVLGVGTFGTGCALLALSVNPVLLVLTDTVVGVGMLFAAGSVSMNDLPLKRREVQEGGPAASPEGIPDGAEEIPAGLRASLGKLKGSLKPPAPGKGKEEQDTRVKEIDKMLDTTLAGQSKRLISLADGQGASAGAARGAAASPAAAAAVAAEHGKDLLEEFSQAEVGTPFGADEEDEGAALPGQAGSAVPGAGLPGARPGPLTVPGEAAGEITADVPSLSDEELGADDLLSALRLEAKKDKKKDDTSLVRDLKGVKVTGKQLVDELGSLVRDMGGR